MERLTYGQLREMVQEAYKLKEANVSAAAGGYNTPKAFGKSKVMRQGMKPVSRPKRPSHTKMFDYLEENNTK